LDWDLKNLNPFISAVEQRLDIQKLPSNTYRVRIRISERLSSIFRKFRLLEKVSIGKTEN